MLFNVVYPIGILEPWYCKFRNFRTSFCCFLGCQFGEQKKTARKTTAEDYGRLGLGGFHSFVIQLRECVERTLGGPAFFCSPCGAKRS